MDAGLIVELGPGPSIGGKPPTLLGVDPMARCIVAIDIGPRVVGVLSDLAGNELARRSVPDERATGQALLDEVTALARELVDLSPAPVAGIGVGSAGQVTPDGMVWGATNLGWNGLPLGDQLMSKTGLPVWVDNNADAAALAEYRTLSSDDQGLALILIGAGVGAGLVFHGQPHVGDRAAAGEIGHLVVDEDGPLCTCDNRGCLETYASVRAIVERAAREAEHDPTDLPADVASLRQILGDRAIDVALETAGTHLGSVLANLVAVVDIRNIVLSLELEGDVGVLTGAVRDTLTRRLLPGHADGVELRVSTLGSDLVLHGARALVLAGALGLTRIEPAALSGPRMDAAATP
jgi:predicted NBD/HSP70 family sugar kinase